MGFYFFVEIGGFDFKFENGGEICSIIIF